MSGGAAANPNPWLHAADLIDPPGADEWFKPNPDPTVTDPERLYRDHTTGQLLVKGRARAKQRPPTVAGWFIWLLMAGRGFGKTRTGAEFIDAEVRGGRCGRQVLIAGRTPSDVRDYALLGEGGLLTHHPDIVYEPSNRHVVWPNGVVGLIRSGANPEEFRGFSGELAWMDELPAWQYPEAAFDNLLFGMREGKNPRIVVTTTPRGIKVMRRIVRMPGTVVVSGSSYENRGNLAEQWVKNVLDPLEGTRLGRQEIEAQLLDDVEGALWTLGAIDDLRVKPADVPALKRVVVGVDPQGVKKEGSMTGIVVVGLGFDGHLYVLEDASINGSPLEWGTRAVAALDDHEADRIIGEKNFGGDMVEATVRNVRKSVPFKAVNASRGKVRRAEPIAALYEQGRGHHVGVFAALEDEMTTYTADADEASPNRLDGLVWAATELTAGKTKRAGVI